MGSAFHQLCPRYSGTLTPTAPTAIRLWDTFTFTFMTIIVLNLIAGGSVTCQQSSNKEYLKIFFLISHRNHMF